MPSCEDAIQITPSAATERAVKAHVRKKQRKARHIVRTSDGISKLVDSTVATETTTGTLSLLSGWRLNEKGTTDRWGIVRAIKGCNDSPGSLTFVVSLQNFEACDD